MAKRTFGQVLVETRKGAGLTQKELAARLRRGDGRLVAPSYLNAVEHDKLNPPEDAVIEQLTRILCIPADILYHHANRLSPDLRRETDRGVLEGAYRAFRKALNKKPMKPRTRSDGCERMDGYKSEHQMIRP